ncbi:type 4 pilus major pilin [Stenotrophomonas sp. PD6]|uniref:type 4 pilus major pilin n=1 Tax=Stenotrophomonas sp. PD6 TaxID=3368612 RepID=UPI003B9E7294
MTPHARPNPRSPAPGFALAELLLALGAAAAMGAAALFFYPRVQTRVHVATDVENLRAMASAIDRSYGVVGTFRNVSASSVVEDNLAPSDFRKGSHGSALSNAWGGPISITPSTVHRFGDSFTVAFSGVPRRACVPFLSAVAGDAYVQDVRVDGTSAKWNTAGQLDVPTLAAACQESGNMLEVVYYSGLASGGSVATVIDPAGPVPSPFLDAPTTPTGAVASAPSVDDALPGTPVAPSPGVPPPAIPAGPALPPAAAIPFVPQPSPIGLPSPLPPALVPCKQAETQAQTGTCPAGTWGTETLRTRTVCPNGGVDPNTDDAWEHPEAWARAVEVVKTIASSCEACPSIQRQTQAQWVTRTGSCPSGTTGNVSREWEQVRSRDITYACPAGRTTAPVPNVGGWSAWSDTGDQRNAVNTCVSTAPRCSDGSLQVAAWYSSDYVDLPLPSGSSAIQYWYPDAVVRLTPAETARLQWALNNVPVTRVETPAPMPGNWPANVSETASYAEQCNALGDVGNINYAYSYDFECVSNMGMHYCDYNWTGGGTSLAVCRQACASDLVGRTNNPYHWAWTESSVVSATPAATCTGQPGCTPNGSYGSQVGMPACNESNVGQAIAYRWYRQFYNPPRIGMQEFSITCLGPKP